jgi:cob(I)alamin adenosyltransferase
MVNDEDVARLEASIDEHEAGLEPLRQFILPGGTPAAAHLHLARTVCRRAERRVVVLCRSGESISEPLVRYLNRLSDLLFVLGRAANAADGRADTPWQKPD